MMAETDLFLDSGPLKIEALLEERAGDGGAVVTHPHPLYGGEMHNHVVDAIVQGFGEMEYTTLRFNFRGVGKSEGRYDNGRGEQDDVEAALRFLSGRGKRHVVLAGYSFGAWVNFIGLNKYENVNGLVLVSPPVGLAEFRPPAFGSKIKLVITGSNDDIAEPCALQEKVMEWNPDAVIRIIDGADHFYWGKAREIREIIKEYLGNEARSPRY